MLALVGLLQMTAMLSCMTSQRNGIYRRLLKSAPTTYIKMPCIESTLHQHIFYSRLICEQCMWKWDKLSSVTRVPYIWECGLAYVWIKELVAASSLDCSYHTLTTENVKHHLVYSAFDSVAGKGCIFRRCLSVAYGKIYLLHEFVELISFQHGRICCLRYRLQQWY